MLFKEFCSLCLLNIEYIKYAHRDDVRSAGDSDDVDETVMLNILLYMVIIVKNKLIKVLWTLRFHACVADHDHGDHDSLGGADPTIRACAYFYSPGIVIREI